MSPKGSSIKYRIFSGLLIIFVVAVTASTVSADWRGMKINRQDAQNIINGILERTNPETRLSVSHFGHPGYETLAFVYDKAVDALILKAAGYQKAAEDIIDYFAARMHIPLDEINAYADTNAVYGILRLFPAKDNANKKQLRGFVNAFDAASTLRQGRGQLEFWITPGPLSFLIFAMLKTNAAKYKDEATELGEILLAMQDDNGGVHDGDRAADKIHVEPHMDAYKAFLMLYKVTAQEKWKRAAEGAYQWFAQNIYHPEEGVIDQGLWQGQRSDIFATDVYAWTMAGPFGDTVNADSLKRLTETMLRRSLVKVTLALPDSTTKTLILCDFTDPEDIRVKNVRGGFHPVGSIEWTGGAILALQKNAVRVSRVNDKKTARFYKAMAEILFEQAMSGFYYIKGLKWPISFYASGQGVEVAPFGSIKNIESSGWRTPFFYARTQEGTDIVKGGSGVGAWVLLPYFGFNPFILEDNYKKEYDQISVSKRDYNNAKHYIDGLTSKRNFYENVPSKTPYKKEQIVEPWIYNRNVWRALELGFGVKDIGHKTESTKHFEEAIKWAQRVVINQQWIELAKRDNSQKEKEFGGIIEYPWGTEYFNNDNIAHYSILRYPLLNEVGVAMWGLASAYFELGDFEKAKYWINRIIEEAPLHQIAVTKKGVYDNTDDTIIGYWNAIVSWEDNPSGKKQDLEMGRLYRELLREKGINSAKPKIVSLAK